MSWCSDNDLMGNVHVSVILCFWLQWCDRNWAMRCEPTWNVLIGSCTYSSRRLVFCDEFIWQIAVQVGGYSASTYLRQRKVVLSVTTLWQSVLVGCNRSCWTYARAQMSNGLMYSKTRRRRRLSLKRCILYSNSYRMCNTLCGRNKIWLRYSGADVRRCRRRCSIS